MKLIKASFILFILLGIISCSSKQLIIQNNVNANKNVRNCIIVYGDTRDGHKTHSMLVNKMMEYKPEMVFHTGDLVSNGNKQEEWNVFNNITKDLRKIAKFYPTMGNHEKNSPLYYANFDLPGNKQWYMIQQDSMYFVVLNSCTDYQKGSVQFAWLDSTLHAIPKKNAFISIILHQPVFSTGVHGSMKKSIRNDFTNLCEKYGVKVVFSGHDHDYEHTVYKGIHYIVAGGGGAPTRPDFRLAKRESIFSFEPHFCKIYLSENKYIIEIEKIDGTLIDKFELSVK